MFLLDTCVVVWLATAPRRIKPPTMEAILTAETVHISEVTPWELTIKAQGGKGLPEVDWDEVADAFGFVRLPVAWGTHAELGRLPPIHKDPFDRLLIAQARLHRLTLITSDEHIADYPVETLW